MYFQERKLEELINSISTNADKKSIANGQTDNE